MLKLKIKEKIQPIKPLWNFWIYLKSIKYNFISFLKEIILFLPNIYRIKKYDQNIKKNCNFKKIKGSSKKKIHFICFSCRKHFKYLFASLKSLEKLNSKSIGNIYLSIDKKDFLTKKEINKILDLNLKITIQANKRITGMGIKSLLNELDIFEKISKNISPNDFVAKIDSDILFISDNIFKKVLKSNGILIGQKEERHGLFIYTQGGCYFLKNKIIESIINQKLYDIIWKVKKMRKRYFHNCAEDAVIYSLVKEKTNKIRFIDCYLPLNKINNITKKDKEKYSVIHFQNQKNLMLEIKKNA